MAKFKLQDEEEKLLIADYLDGVRVCDFVEKYGISESSIRRLRVRRGVAVIKPKQRRMLKPKNDLTTRRRKAPSL